MRRQFDQHFHRTERTMSSLLRSEHDRSACAHHPLECVQIYLYDRMKCCTDFNHWTTVKDLIDDFQETSTQISHARLYMKDNCYVYPLDPNAYIEDILVKQFLLNKPVKFLFYGSSTRVARRRRLSQISLHQPTDPTMTFDRRSSVDRDIDLLISIVDSPSRSTSFDLETLV